MSEAKPKMWTRAEDVPKETVDALLERFDQAAPDVQRLVVLQWMLDVEHLKRQLAATPETQTKESK